MADRLSQYSMGHNFAPGSGAGMIQQHQLNAMQQQQQQLQQQQSGQQQPDSSQQPHPGMPGFSDQRIWSQMQHMQQMRNQNGQDMNTSQQQMADLVRSQNMAQMQSQQQRFGGLGMGGPSSNQQHQTPHNMQMSFGNMNMDQQHSSGYQSLQHRQNMLQALQNNQQHTRQLELMVSAQNQQNQNGPTNLGNRVNSVPLNNASAGLNPLQSQNDMFSNPNDMRRPSPHPPLQPALMGNQPPNPNGMVQNPRGTTLQVQGRTINLADLTERAATLRNMIQNQELQMRQLQTQRTGMPDNIFMAKIRSFQTDIANRKESLNKILTLTNICLQQNNGGSMNNIGHSPGGPPPPGSNGQSWQTPPFGNGSQSSSQPQPPGPGQRSSPAPPHPQVGHPISPPSNVPPRTGPTPQQSMNPFPSLTPSPLTFPMGNAPTVGPPGPNNAGQNASAPSINSNMISPLDKQRFETSYKQWCLTKNIVHDPRLLAIESRPIDLFQLHCHVMREGGIQNVTRKELWPVIGGRLGVIHFPGTTTEPPKSGPAAAIHIQHVYKEYLSAFDTVYMASVLDSRRKTGQLPGAQFPPALSFPDIVRGFNPHQLRMIIACADKTAVELRARGMSESMVSFIENHRASLQNMAVDQENFGNDLRRTQPTNPGQPIGGQPNMMGNPGQPPFVRPPGEHQPPPLQPGQIPRPTREQMGVAHMNINRLKADYTARVIPMMPAAEVPPANRAEYSSLLDVVFRLANDLDNKLAVFSVVTKSEENTRKLLSAVVTVQHQRALLASPNPKFIVPFDTLRIFFNQLQNAARHIHVIIQNMLKDNLAVPTGDQHLGGSVQGINQPHLPHPSASPQLPPPQVNGSLPRPPPILNPPPLKNNKKPVSTPTPPASAATPAASAPTPTAAAASPQTPKSPKPKAKKKPVPRKITKNSTPTLEPTQIPTPAAGGKRPREEEPEPSQPTPGSSAGPSSSPMPPPVNEPSPPKRAKTDWEGPISQSLQKKNQAVENIKTEEDASQFLEQMTELIKMAGSEEQTSLSSDISDTLEQFLKGYGGMSDSDTSISLGLGEVGSMDGSTSQLPPNDLTEFFDFSLFPNEDEFESKGTPDLISSSSTNPSPESQADADPAHHVTALLDVKQEEYDPLRLGTLKEIDGGESAYYQSTDWKWDGQMATLEQPWAIFNS